MKGKRKRKERIARGKRESVRGEENRKGLRDGHDDGAYIRTESCHAEGVGHYLYVVVLTFLSSLLETWLPAPVFCLHVSVLLSVLVGAQQKGHPASTFYLEETETQFSVSLARDSSDVFIYLTSPAFSWVGFGFGKEMKDSLMLVAYLSGDGNSTFAFTTLRVLSFLYILCKKGDRIWTASLRFLATDGLYADRIADVTLSPRTTTSHSEPVFDPTVDLEILNGTGVQDSMFVLNARCSNCRVWSGGFLDAASATQPMIFAFGPATQIQTDARDAPLRRHVRYGTFTMDMVAASSSDAGVPSPASEAKGVVVQELKKDSDKMGRAHSVLGCLALFVLWPVNVVIAGFVRRVQVHVGFSILIVVMLCVSYGLGIATSKQYLRVRPAFLPRQSRASSEQAHPRDPADNHTVPSLPRPAPNLRLRRHRPPPPHVPPPQQTPPRPPPLDPPHAHPTLLPRLLHPRRRRRPRPPSHRATHAHRPRVHGRRAARRGVHISHHGVREEARIRTRKGDPEAETRRGRRRGRDDGAVGTAEERGGGGWTPEEHERGELEGGRGRRDDAWAAVHDEYAPWGAGLCEVEVLWVVVLSFGRVLGWGVGMIPFHCVGRFVGFLVGWKGRMECFATVVNASGVFGVTCGWRTCKGFARDVLRILSLNNSDCGDTTAG